MHKETLEDIGEKELINRLGKFMPKNQASDDCALIKTKNNNLLINNDSLVENVHFNDISISPQDLGWKAVISNLSDLLSSGSQKTSTKIYLSTEQKNFLYCKQVIQLVKILVT